MTIFYTEQRDNKPYKYTMSDKTEQQCSLDTYFVLFKPICIL